MAARFSKPGSVQNDVYVRLSGDQLGGVLTMRQLQRAAARRAVTISHKVREEQWGEFADQQVWETSTRVGWLTRVLGAPVNEFPTWRYTASTRQVDRLAALYPDAVYDADNDTWHGLPALSTVADAPVESDYAPKDTSEVVESESLTSNEVHGGNNRSYEVADSVSSNPSDGVNQTPQGEAGNSGNNASQRGEQSPQRVSPAGEPSTAAPEAEAAVRPAASGYGTPSAQEKVTPPADQAGEPDRVMAKSAGVPESPAQRSHPAAAPGSNALPSGSPASEETVSPSGGASQWETELAAALELPKFKPAPTGQKGRRSSTAFYRLTSGQTVSHAVIRETRKALEAWVADLGDMERSGRWNAGKLAVRARVKSGVARAMREDLGMPGILVMVDVSGSCLGFAPDALVVAQAVAEIGMQNTNIVIVTHSNGYPVEVSVNGGAAQQVEMGAGDTARIPTDSRYLMDVCAPWYVRLAARHGITHVLAMGDADAWYEYIALANHPQVDSLIWLDNYACNNEPLTIKTPRSLGRKARRVYACGTVDDLPRGLMMAIK